MNRNLANLIMGIILTVVLILVWSGRIRTVQAQTTNGAAAAGNTAAASGPATTGFWMLGTWKNDTTTVNLQVGGDFYANVLGKTGFHAYAGLYHVVDRTHIRIAPFASDAPLNGVYEVKLEGDLLNQMILMGSDGTSFTLNRVSQTQPGLINNP